MTGFAGHAGTVPMTLRKDALAAAAQMALAVEQHCAARADRLVGTVGKFAVDGGGAINVIPGSVSFTVDVRSGDDVERRLAAEALRADCEDIAESGAWRSRGTRSSSFQAAPCDPAPHDAAGRVHRARGREGALAAERRRPRRHGDGEARTRRHALRALRRGRGHHDPAETLDERDADIATAVLLDFLERFRPSEPSG